MLCSEGFSNFRAIKLLKFVSLIVGGRNETVGLFLN